MRLVVHVALWIAAGVALILSVGMFVNGWRLAGSTLLLAAVLFAASSVGAGRLPYRPAWAGGGVALLVIGMLVAAIQGGNRPSPQIIAASPPTVVPTVAPARTPTTAPAATATSQPRAIGQPSVLTDAKGGRLSVVVNAVEDDVQPGRFQPAPQGRYMVIDWTVKNDGATEITLNRLELKVQTTDGYIIQRAGATIREPDLQTAKIGPGQAVRGWLAYDIPTGQRPATAIYQPEGSRQFAVADLPR